MPLDEKEFKKKMDEVKGSSRRALSYLNSLPAKAG